MVLLTYEHKQRDFQFYITVPLYGQTSECREIISGVPEGLVLQPLLFLIDTNDLPYNITSLCNFFADDTSLFSKFLI